MTPTREPGTPVLIVGAGPTGATTALLLADLGVPSVVVERHREAYPLPRAVHLDDEVFRILQRAGVAAEFAGISRAMPGLRLVDRRLHTLAEFLRDKPIGSNGFPQANMFDQPDLERLLLRAVAANELITLRRGVELTGFEQGLAGDTGQVRVTVRDVDSGQEEILWTPAVLGCDGANSMVARRIGAEMTELGPEDRWFVVDIRCSTQLDVWNGVQQVCDPHRAATFMQVGPDRYRWEFRLLDGETAADLSPLPVLMDLLEPWLGPHPTERLELLRHTEYVFKANLTDTWRNGRVFLLGDAAHQTPPFIGQGMGLGLRDAANLAWKLAAVLDGADDALLDTYGTERAPHARQLIRLAVTLGWAMTGGSDRAAGVRKAVLTALKRIPPLTAKIADTTAPPLKPGELVQRSAFRSALRGHAALEGQLIPQPWLQVEGGRRRLDDVLGPGCAVVTVLPPDAGLRALADRSGSVMVHLGGPSADGVVGCTDENGLLSDWLRRGRAGAVFVRPDRVVLAAVTRGSGYGEALARRAAPLTELLTPPVPTPRTRSAAR